MPTIRRSRRRPLIVAATVSPGTKPCASANPSLASTSSAPRAAGRGAETAR